MVAIKKAVVAVDFSDESTYIAEYAKLFAEKFDAELIVVYAAPSLNQYVGFHVPPNTIESFVGEIVTGAEKSMESFLEKHFAGIKTTGKVVTGFAAEEILEIADDEKADLIIMGTHGRTGIDRILFGSVAAKIVRGADIPVLTVRPDFDK
ncbi:universal stress protein [Halodesulfovibrio sp.]|jgi:nucleotide-binding universal stress UspA family protein|uniref:universal stress protein n=1 Tax=Halodesulfovibrio sp. TaxID=1912772 RepID=UPI0025E18F0D|nr:universal stress protein [Halodesulfovibrio sp.]MCT4534148.1 universal stress protein [Halodesulfovibrio sp.]MCT4625912.1 universal stress protein [Halodesulfovibrio sp.]